MKNISKFTSSTLKNEFNSLFKNKYTFSSLFYSSLNKNFSGGHGGHGGHGHDASSENDYHSRKLNRVSYNKVLNNAEREKLHYIDYMNESDVDYIKLNTSIYNPTERYEIMAPYATAREDKADILLDRTEIQARIYNLLRQFDFKPLEEIDFDADFEKDLGLDSLEWTALITSIEHEFHTVFEDSLYGHFRTVNEFVELLEKDFSCF